MKLHISQWTTILMIYNTLVLWFCPVLLSAADTLANLLGLSLILLAVYLTYKLINKYLKS